MKQVTIAIAGCGSRGMDTYAQCLQRYPERARIVAAADMDPVKLHIMQEKYGLREDQCYQSAEDMLKRDRLADAMIIATPDRAHYEQATVALNKGYHLLLEKPIAVTEQQCRELIRLAKEKNRQVIVCHVLRYTAFYQKLRELIRQGTIGSVMSVQAIEQVGYWHQAHSFVRGNWRNADLSTPMILQKCCHDMDIILWLLGKHCRQVSSFGSLTHFIPENAPAGAPQRCTDGCPAGNTCPYNAVRYYITNGIEKGKTGWPVNILNPEPTSENIMDALRQGPYGRCVYHCDNNVPDHQVVNLNLEDGATVNFTMCAFTKNGGRHIRLMGTRGEIVGDMGANTITVMPFMGEREVIDVRTLTDDFSGHGGGDALLIDTFLHLLSEEEYDTDTLSAIDCSLESHLVEYSAPY